MHTVAVLALDTVNSYDLSIPSIVFGTARTQPSTADPTEASTEQRLYDVRFCGPEEGVDVHGPARGPGFRMIPPHPLEAARDADTIVVPCASSYAERQPDDVLDLLRDAHADGSRIISTCNGAFVLAQAGLLDDLRATTHWTHAAELIAAFPRVRVDPTVLFVDNGSTATSAAGMDLCLHLVGRDFGAAVAAYTARHVVMPLQRTGGQAQFIIHEQPENGGSLEPTIRWMYENLRSPLTLRQIADHAAMSVRTLNRRFHAQTGTTPLQWLIRQRLQRAQNLLETTTMPIEEIADWAGFGTAIAMRQHFSRVFGTTPLGCRRAFQLTDSAS